MSNEIKVARLGQNPIWEKSLTLMECEKVKGLMLKGQRAVTIVEATLFPVRTNNLINFSQDFFLPTTFNHAIKVQSLAAMVFALMASLVLDLLTFPVRLLTCIPRAILNSRQEEIPFHKYLAEVGADKRLLEADSVLVQLKTELPSENELIKGQLEKEWYKLNVHFIQVPSCHDIGISSGKNMDQDQPTIFANTK